MEKQLLVLSCSKTKRGAPGLLPAIDRYDGSPYRVLRNYLRKHQWPENLSVAILSAKYGLVGGFTGISDYDERMTPAKASGWAPVCSDILESWGRTHSRVHLALGKDYLPAVSQVLRGNLEGRSEVFRGPIGTKLNQIKGFLERTDAPNRRPVPALEPGSGQVSYFLPDWDDLLDGKFDFEKDSFSGPTRVERDDKHCCVLMQPKRMCDGVLVSLAQHITSKGPLRKILGTDSSSLAPSNLRRQFGLASDQALFGDCGAFSYVNEDSPSISVEQAVSLYDLHSFDFGASVDHIPVLNVVQDGNRRELTEEERTARVETTTLNAQAFLREAKRRQVGFIPVGTIQALTPKDYGARARLYHEMGYRHLAIGGLVPLPDAAIEQIAREVMAVVDTLKPRPWIHLFGIFRPKLQLTFRQLRIDSFDSATYFRKAWLRSDQNYLGCNGKWYAAIRVPMTSDGRTRKRLEESQVDLVHLEQQEANVMSLICRYDRDEVQVDEVLDAVIEYDERLTRSSESKSLRATYAQTLRDKPWRSCDCPFCTDAGIHVLVFRGANRNKRRGAHNTLMLYGSVHGEGR